MLFKKAALIHHKQRVEKQNTLFISEIKYKNFSIIKCIFVIYGVLFVQKKLSELYINKKIE